ncbi:MAG: T9SS type A sorting domain-containing protein [Ignavibacteria bacterium]|nr:T9SS type A sorting domain-containing protein [Ignavibacteria bacterium]
MVKSLDTKGLFRVNVLDRLTWLVASGNGNILFTTDGGTSWLDVSIPGSMLPWTIDNCIVINTSEFLVSSNEYVYHGKLSGTTSNLDDSMSSRHSVTPTLLSIAPNPSTNSATITVADRSPVLRLYDASGRLVASYTVENGRVVVNTSELSNGVYNVVSDTGSGVLMVNR